MPSLRDVLEGITVAAVANGANYVVTGEWLSSLITVAIAVVATGTAYGYRKARRRNRVGENAVR